ncbi:MAG: ATP-binding protein [Bacteroidota bacterium]
MLLRFVAKNFLSLGEEIEFNLFPYTKLRSHKDHIYDLNDVSLLKSAAIYGANGSGKSNFVKAIHLLHDIATNQNISAARLSEICFKLNTQLSCEATSLEIEFEKSGRFFSYGVDILDQRIVEEWLVLTSPHNANKDVLIFERKTDESGKIKIKLHEKYVQSDRDKLRIELYEEEMLRHEESLLSFLNSKGKDEFRDIEEAFSWFQDDLYILYPGSLYAGLIEKFLRDDHFLNYTNSIISTLDTGVSELGIKEVPFEIFFGDDDKDIKNKILSDFKKGKKKVNLRNRKGVALAVQNEKGEIIIQKLITRHVDKDGKVCDFELKEESDGTTRILDLLPAFELLSQRKCVFVIDEIGRSIHPALLKEFTRYFLEAKTQGQLIFTTHESYLLDLDNFRQDEIWFTEKDDAGNTRMYPLSEFMPRYDFDIRKGYLNGRFGAIPFLGDFSKLIVEHAS